jgi:hypothetical protein
MRLSFSNKNIDLSFPGSLSSGSLTLFNNSDLVGSSFMLERERERLTWPHARVNLQIKFLIYNNIACLNSLSLVQVFHTPYTLLPILFLNVCCLNRFPLLVKVGQSIRIQTGNCMYVFVTVSGKGYRGLCTNSLSGTGPDARLTPRQMGVWLRVRRASGIASDERLTPRQIN